MDEASRCPETVSYDRLLKELKRRPALRQNQADTLYACQLKKDLETLRMQMLRNSLGSGRKTA